MCWEVVETVATRGLHALMYGHDCDVWIHVPIKVGASSKLDRVHLLLLFLSTLMMKSTVTQGERLVKGMFDFFFCFLPLFT
jgi:hypothetical protein